MKKRDLELARSSRNLSFDTQALKARVSQDLAVVKDAYDISNIALTELSKAFGNVSDARELAYLAKAYADIVKSVVTLRQEGRTTVQSHIDGAEHSDEHSDEHSGRPRPGRVGGGGRAGSGP